MKYLKKTAVLLLALVLGAGSAATAHAMTANERDASIAAFLAKSHLLGQVTTAAALGDSQRPSLVKSQINQPVLIGFNDAGEPVYFSVDENGKGMAFALSGTPDAKVNVGIGKRAVEGEPLFLQGGGFWGGQEIADPGTPPSGEWWFYVDSTSHAVVMESNGTENVIAGLSAPVGVTSGGTGLSTVADTGILFASAADTFAVDATNFKWIDTANGQYVQIGAGTSPGEIRLLEGSGGGTNYTAVKAAASQGTVVTTLPTVTWTGLTANPSARNLFESVSSAGAHSVLPAQVLLYESLTASTAHTGATAAETTKMPATAEGTADTDIGTAMTAGAHFTYQVWVDATGDADGDETLTVNIYFGAQLVGTSGAIAVDGATDIVVNGWVNLEAAGASIAGNYISLNGSYPGVATTTAARFTAFDTTATQAFAVKLDWGGTTDAADTATTSMASLTVNNVDS